MTLTTTIIIVTTSSSRMTSTSTKRFDNDDSSSIMSTGRKCRPWDRERAICLSLACELGKQLRHAEAM